MRSTWDPRSPSARGYGQAHRGYGEGHGALDSASRLRPIQPATAIIKCTVIVTPLKKRMLRNWRAVHGEGAAVRIAA